ncbi:MAG TPA: outer membrane beta-barrel protein [Hyphomonadaceae bacterium]|nr:outer membrane beta-barrel protein [Hyphomonadaceae bacterium]HPN05634.1 outer membrane beta-barrel protein [Hyphomonadaceae bacterium]
MKFGFKHLMLTTALVGVVAPVASAQDNPFLRGRHTPVAERAQPEFNPEPIRTGSFVVDSNVLLGAELNSNVFAQPSGEVEDTIIRIRPEVIARSNWAVHSLTLGARVDHREYTGEGSETSTDYDLFANGRLDVTRNFSFSANASGGQFTEARYEPGSQNAPEPAKNKYVAADVAAGYRTDRLLVQGTLGTRKNDFQSFYPQRDMTETYANIRGSYAISPDVALFAEVRETDFDYDSNINSRDGSQTAFRAGVNFELTAPFRGEIAVGQVTDKRDAAGVKDIEALNLDATLLWFPTQLTTVTFRGFSGITDPGILEAFSADTQRYSVRADHELLRNVLIFGQVGMTNYDFNAAPGYPLFNRKDELLEASVGAVYKLNKQMHLEGGYTLNSRDGSGIGATDVDQSVLSIGLRFFP